MNHKIYTFFLCLLSITATGQNTFINNGFYGNMLVDIQEEFSFDTDDEVNDMVTAICRSMNLKNKIIVKSNSQVKNCVAKVYVKKNRMIYAMIFFNSEYLDRIRDFKYIKGKLKPRDADWKVIAIMAHEFGHHVNFHFINQYMNPNPYEIELEADDFAGGVLYRMGATLEQAQEVMYDTSIKPHRTDTHPSRQERLDAIARGYNFWKNMQKGISADQYQESLEVVTTINSSGFEFTTGDEQGIIDTFKKYASYGLISSPQQFHLAEIFAHGTKGVEKDLYEAFKWYLKSADNGHALAQLRVGEYNEWGLAGLVKSETEALKWYTLSANGGNAKAQRYMGEFYKNGKGGLKKDDRASYKWFKISAERDNAEAQRNMGEIFLNGNSVVEKDITTALNWFAKSAEGGNAEAYYQLGELFDKGNDVTKNVKKAVMYYEKAAKLDNGIAIFRLAQMYQDGDGVEQSDIKSAQWKSKFLKLVEKLDNNSQLAE